MNRLAIGLLFAFALGCGPGAGSPDVGGACTTDRDCDSICSTVDTFGAGMCTRRCTTDNDCPEGSVCVEKGGGICAVSCSTTDDCADFGRGFKCDHVKRESGGETLVCRLP